MRNVARVALVALPLLVCVVRVQSHTVATPQALAKELVRCLSVARSAASRRMTVRHVGAARGGVSAGPPAR